MKTWEIVKGMYYGKYKEGTIFQNAEIGDMIIESDGELCYLGGDRVPMLTNDESDWEVL